MSSDTMKTALDNFLVGSGFEWLPDSGTYRGTVDIEGTTRRQNVFTRFDDSSFAFMSSVGLQSDVDDEALERARQPDDGLSVVFAASYVALETRGLSVADAIDDPNRIVEKAIWLGYYADRVSQNLARDRARFAELGQQIQPWLNSPESLTADRVNGLIAALEEALTIRPIRSIWVKLYDSALRLTQWCWAQGVGGSTLISDQPWDKVSTFLEKYGNQHGWQLEEGD